MNPLRFRSSSIKQISFALLLIITLSINTLKTAGADWDTIVLGGWQWPQGSTIGLVDDGFNITGRAVLRSPDKVPLMLWGDIRFMNFRQTTEEIIISSTNFDFDATETRSQEAFAVHIGAQLASPTRRATLRPFGGIGIGPYFRQDKVKITTEDSDDPIFEDEVGLVRLGWMGYVGTDIYFTQMFGINLEFTYDQIWNVEDGVGVRFLGFALGVTIPFPTPWKKDKNADGTGEKTEPTDN